MAKQMTVDDVPPRILLTSLADVDVDSLLGRKGPIREKQASERQYELMRLMIIQEQSIRECNRAVFGLFRWRYYRSKFIRWLNKGKESND